MSLQSKESLVLHSIDKILKPLCGTRMGDSFEIHTEKLKIVSCFLFSSLCSPKSIEAASRMSTAFSSPGSTQFSPHRVKLILYWFDHSTLSVTEFHSLFLSHSPYSRITKSSLSGLFFFSQLFRVLVFQTTITNTKCISLLSN